MSRIRYKNFIIYFIIVLAVLNESAFAARARRKSNSNIQRAKTRQVTRPTISSQKPRTINTKTVSAWNNHRGLRRPSAINSISRRVNQSISMNQKQSAIRNVRRSSFGITKHISSPSISNNPLVLNKAKQSNIISNIPSRSTETLQHSNPSINTKSSFNYNKKPSTAGVSQNGKITTTEQIGAFINSKKSFSSANPSKPEIVSEHQLSSSVNTHIRPPVGEVKLPVQEMKIQSHIVQRKQLSPSVVQTVGSFVGRKETPPLNRTRENQVSTGRVLKINKGEPINRMVNIRGDTTPRTDNKLRTVPNQNKVNSSNRQTFFNIGKRIYRNQQRLTKPDKIAQSENSRISKRPSVSAEEMKPHRSEREALVTNEAVDGKKAFIANKSEGIEYKKKNATKTRTREMHKGTDERISKESLPRLRLKKDVPDGRRNLIKEMSRDDHKVRERTRIHRYETERYPRKVYRDQLHSARRINRYIHIYRDCHDRVCHRIIWPRYRFLVNYRCGPHFTFRYVYPYYHRKYIFISLGGFWPIEYSYIRYYWYGCHPYIWCGYYPIAREVQGDTYNYYTYNYYNNEDVSAGYQPEQEGGEDYIEPVDHTTFEDVREKLAEQAAKPAEPTPADILFEEAVESFESSDYVTAIEKFSKAMELAPEDMVLPFAYAQALFADEQYYQAAEVIRTALSKVSPEKQGVFYPRGLYPNDELLFEQIERLAEKAERESDNADLQLLLGYHYLGIGQIDAASEPLKVASQDLKSCPAATVLLDLMEEIKADNAVQSDVSDINESQSDNLSEDSKQ